MLYRPPSGLLALHINTVLTQPLQGVSSPPSPRSAISACGRAKCLDRTWRIPRVDKPKIYNGPNIFKILAGQSSFLVLCAKAQNQLFID